MSEVHISHPDLKSAAPKPCAAPESHSLQDPGVQPSGPSHLSLQQLWDRLLLGQHWGFIGAACSDTPGIWNVKVTDIP